MANLSTAFRLQIPRQLYDEMVAQAVAEAPNECCGLLAGTPDGRVTHRYALVNAAASPVGYLSDPRSMFEAVRDMRRHNIDVVAVYHSHPTSEAVPSRKDREQNYSVDIVNLIISLKGEAPAVRGWWLSASAAREAEWDVIE
jgi:proteasome lid subunit RPN8/RPN11